MGSVFCDSRSRTHCDQLSLSSSMAQSPSEGGRDSLEFELGIGWLADTWVRRIHSDYCISFQTPPPSAVTQGRVDQPLSGGAPSDFQGCVIPSHTVLRDQTQDGWIQRKRKRRLFSENDPDSGAVLFGFGLDTDYIASQAKWPVRRSPDSWIIELDLQFGLQSWTMIQVNQRAVQAQIADNRLFLKRHARVGKASHHGSEVSVAAQAFADSGNQDIQIRAS